MTAAANRDDAWYRRRLALPGTRPRLVIDSDAANEIDDPFALAWALLRPERLQVEAVYAAPYSFAHRRAALVQADRARRAPAQADDAGRALARRHAAALDHFERRGWDPATVALPCFDPPGIGMERSHAAVLTVFDRLGLDPRGRVLRGATGYLEAPGAPRDSEAAQHLIAAALATPADGPPLYVAAIGCATNVASALLLAPEIAEHIVVVWTSGYPSHAPQRNDSFNLEQDLHATRVLLDSGVPHVYLPGFQVGAQLRLSLAEMERSVQGRGAIGAHLFELYTHNPLWDLQGVPGHEAHSWVLWDLINIAWLIEPDWVPSELVRTPRLDDDRRWRADPTRHPMREAYGVQRDAIFGDFFAALGRAGPGTPGRR